MMPEWLAKLILLAVGILLLLFFILLPVVDILLGTGDILKTETVPVVVDRDVLEHVVHSSVYFEGHSYGDVQSLLDAMSGMPGLPSQFANVAYPPLFENSKYRWAFAKIVADKILECCEKTVLKSGKLTAVLAVREVNPTSCAVCYTIHVAPNARELLVNEKGRIDDFYFYDWLNLNSPLRQKSSYYDIITDSFRFPAGLSLTRFEVSEHRRIDLVLKNDPADDIAVVFVHVPLVGGDWLRVPGVTGKSANLDFVSLYSYKNLAKTILVSFERDFAGLDFVAPDVEARCGET